MIRKFSYMSKRIVFLFGLFIAILLSCDNGGGGADIAIEDTSFSIGYNANGAESGSAPVAQSGNASSPQVVQANVGSLAKNGYLFDGWNTQPDGFGADYAPGTEYTGKENITLYAKWVKIFNYVVNSISPAPSVDAMQKASGVPTATITGLTARGMALADIVIPESIDGYTVSRIETNAFQNCNRLSDVTIPNTVSDIGDNAFSGCSRLSNITLLGITPPAIGVGVLDNCSAIINVPQNAVVTYQGAPGWDTYSTSIVYIGASTYCLIYDGNGADSGNVPMMRVSAVGGYPIIVDGNTDGLTRAGCTFNGWNTAPDGSGNAKNAGDTIQLMGGRITLYAQWYHPDWVVTFDSQEADIPAFPSSRTIVAPANTMGTLPAEPLRAGYNFAGWYTKPDGQGNQVTTSTVIYGNTAVYAKWNEGSFQITYNANGADKGTVPSAQKGITNNSVTISDNTGNLSKVGYTFKGWNTRSDGTGEPFVVGASYSGPKDITLYAQWNYNVYNILIDDISNGVISLNATEDIAPGTVVTLKMTPARGYKLDSLTVTKARGGSVVLSGTGSTLIFSMPDDNVIVRATFTLLYTSTPGNRVGVNVGDIVLADGNTVTAANYSINANAYTALDGVPVGVIAYEGNSTTGGTTAQGGGIGLWYIVQIDYDDTKLCWTNRNNVGYGEQPRLLCNSSGSYSGYYNTYSIAAKWSDYSVNNYPAFAKAINYHAPGTIESNKYYSDWFLPTWKELQRLIRGVDENGNTLTTESTANLAKINSSISVLAKAGVSEANAISTQYWCWFWSSSQSGRRYAEEAVKVSNISGILCPHNFAYDEIHAPKSVPEAVVVIRALD